MKPVDRFSKAKREPQRRAVRGPRDPRIMAVERRLAEHAARHGGNASHLLPITV